MRRGGRRPGTGTSFIDAFTAEVLLQVSANDRGETLIAYCLYDSNGTLVADSGGLQDFAEGDEVRGKDDELLLLIPNSLENHIEYRLYSHEGALLTCSDGIRTQLFGGIRVEGIKPAGRVPLPTPTLVAAVAVPGAIKSEVDVQP